ncbi:MAG: Vms1/Ankzf1 family peptidyl-tRNA hydrolase [Chloroflexota bacterium]
MAIETREVRELIGFAPEGFLVTSLYLNTDAGELPSPALVMTGFDSLVHEAESRRKIMEDSLSHDATESIRADLARARQFVDQELDRTDTGGVAMFSCSAQAFWEVVHLPDPVTSSVRLEPRPFVGPIAGFLSHSKPTAVLLTDRTQARIFTLKHGEVREWSSFEDWVPHHTKSGGWSQARYQRRSDAWARHHIDKASELTLALLQHYPFDWLILGTDTDAQHDLLESLHPYLKDRLIGQIHVRIDAEAKEVLAAANELREQTEDNYINDLMDRVQEYAGAGGRGTIGLEDTLDALNEQKVHILLVQDGCFAPGSRCSSCEMLYAKQLANCPACGGRANPVDNIVEIAVQRAMELDSAVEVATEIDKLKPVQCIASIMYY